MHAQQDFEICRRSVVTIIVVFTERLLDDFYEVFHDVLLWTKLHLDIKKKFELESCRLQPDTLKGKVLNRYTASLARLVMDLEKFENCPWGRVVFKVLMDSLKAKDLTQTGYTVDGFIQVLQVWAYYAMPELGANYGSPIPDRPSPLLLAYKGGQGRRRCFKSGINRQHWFAIWISIPKRHIVVWDNIIKHISPEELDEVMEPFVTMVLYLLVECAVSNEQKVQYTLEPYTYENKPLEYLGAELLCPRNGKTIREKMAVDIFQELSMCHEWENQDNDENLGTYE
ncbi:hypothetical protein Bca52824_081728 [Brassica carinata]|uniref:Ubiquitin-like protease family profile domain-containing protein n=1 Tax=Brassica carinata TaxID=52824 RepID=A0A8X7PJ43_BRACI|nr:hypothetical protein Bca52824_081728 [Brassica carinata]